MSTKYRVKAERTFQSHNAGDVLLVEATPEIEQLVRSKLFTVLAVIGGDPVATVADPPKPKSKPSSKPPRKKAAAKTKARAVKNV